MEKPFICYNRGMNNGDAAKNLTQINQSFETRDAQARAHDAGLAFIDLLTYPLNPDVLKLVPVEDATQAQAIPFYKNGLALKLAVVDPKNDHIPVILHDLEAQRYTVELVLCTQSGFDKTLQHYDSTLVSRKKVEVRHEFDEKLNVDADERFKGFASLISTLEMVPINQALNEIEIAAIQSRASDIHLQPYEDRGELRFRMDGILHTVGSVPAEKALKIVGQIKYEAGMKANITDVPQDGHITFVANQRKIDLRVSSLPTEFGESIVMRVLDSGRGIKSFTELGFDSVKEQKILQVLTRKNGMVLVTGPTGSGKTTTLYAMLKELNSPEKKLVTLEDPIEYHLDEVIQSQVSSHGDYNFGSGLKALLRHDPDVMLIGEIRDLDTAKLAAEASLTGHVVLSSLHTNSAIGAVTRLRNLGLESFNIASSLNAVFAQRLVRKVCPHCSSKTTFDLEQDETLSNALKQVTQAHPEVKSHLEFTDTSPVDGVHRAKTQLRLTTASSNGCDQCADTGYLGQTVIAEVVIMDKKMQEKLSGEASELELEKIVRKNDPTFLTLFEDGVRKLILGETTLEEVYRVAG